VKPVHTIITAEDQLRLMRSGYKAELELKYGQLKVPCRLMSALEESATITNAKKKLKVPNESDRKLLESIAVMKAVLVAACTVDDVPHLSLSFLDKLTDTELDALYDQFMTIKETADPEFEKLSPDQVRELVSAVKKKEKATRDLFTWQLAAIGKFFLDEILPAASEAGS
jgi:hypothetical protein